MELTNGGLVTALALRGGSGRNLNPKRPRPTEVLTLSGGHAQPPRMIEYFRNRRLTDVTIRACDGRTFEAHRNILAASSDYLHGRMGADWSDSAGPIEFPHLSASALEKLLEYVYVGEVSLSESLIIPLLECAHYLQVLSLLHAAAVAIQLRLEASNSLETWTLADRYSITTLEKAAMKVVLKEFAQCRAGSTFLRMPLRFMRDLLEADMLLAPEEDVFESTVDWLRAQPAAALAEAAATLLNLVRYPQLPRQYVSERVMMDPLLQQLPGGAAAILLPSMMDKSYGTPSRTWNARGVPRGVQRDLPRSFLDGWTQHVCV
jgi:kelch-like protein 31